MIRRLAKGAATALPDLLRDMAVLGGAGLVAYGAHEIYAPLGFISGGALLIAGAILEARGG